jgi:hypothetical protein
VKLVKFEEQKEGISERKINELEIKRIQIINTDA